jgi:hypothetical protein
MIAAEPTRFLLSGIVAGFLKFVNPENDFPEFINRLRVQKNERAFFWILLASS